MKTLLNRYYLQIQLQMQPQFQQKIKPESYLQDRKKNLNFEELYRMLKDPKG